MFLSTCPCCSGKPYAECCKPYHLGASVPSPLALMRSRYSAYALKNCDYIIQTTHPKSVYFEKDLETWKRAIEQFSEETRFLKLEIVQAEGDTVTFIAHLEQKGKPFLLKEKSLFQKENGKWLYLSGEIY